MTAQFGSTSGFARQGQRRQMLLQICCVVFCTTLFFAAIVITRTNSIATKSGVAEANIETPAGTVAVVVANSDVPKGTRLSADHFRSVPWPRDSVPEGAARTFEEVENMYAAADLPDSVPIRHKQISITPPSLGIDQNLLPGYRAVGISVTATTNVEGRTTAGSHVDVLLTYSDPRDGQITTTLVAENALVLSFGGDAVVMQKDNPNRSLAEMQTSTATIAVTTEDSLKIQTAMQMGRISLVLRSKDDLGATKTRAIRASDITQARPTPTVHIAKQASDGVAKFTGPDGHETQFRLRDRQWEEESTDPLG